MLKSCSCSVSRMLQTLLDAGGGTWAGDEQGHTHEGGGAGGRDIQGGVASAPHWGWGQAVISAHGKEPQDGPRGGKRGRRMI